MRNYVQTFWARTEWDFDPTPPDPPTHRQQYLFSPTDDDLTLQIQLFFEGLASDPFNKNMTVARRGPVYWLMDKVNLFYSLDMSHVALKDQGFTENMIMFPGENEKPNPRDGWKDVELVERKPPPSEGGPGEGGKGGTGVPSGYNYPVDFLTSLVLLYQALLKVKRTDLAKRLEPCIKAVALHNPLPISDAAFQQLLDEIQRALGT